MTQLNLKVEDKGLLLPKSSWVDNERKTDLRKIASVDSVAVGHYLRKDGLIVAKRDTLTVAVVYQTDGKHGKSVAIDDTPGAFSFGAKSLTSGTVFQTIDGQRAEGVINDSSASEDERLIYKPEMPYSADTAFGFKDGSSLTSSLMRSKSGKDEGSALAVTEKHRGAYIPTLAEMADLYYRLQPYAHTKLGDLIEPFTGEYLTCSESSTQTIYGIDMTKGVVMSHYSKQHSHLKLRLIYLF